MPALTSTQPVTLDWGHLKSIVGKHQVQPGFAKEIASGKVVLSSGDLAKYEVNISGGLGIVPDASLLQVKLVNEPYQVARLNYCFNLELASFKYINSSKQYEDDRTKRGIGPWRGVNIPVTIYSQNSRKCSNDPYCLDWTSEETGGDLEVARDYYRACLLALQSLVEEQEKNNTEI